MHRASPTTHVVRGETTRAPIYTRAVTMTLLVRDRRVIAIQAAIGWCLGGLGPALILGSRDLDLPRYQLSWLGSAFGFTLLIAGLLGSRALKRGPMPVVAAGAAMLITGTMLLAFGASLPLLAAGGLLQGAGSSAFLIATPALVVGAGRARRLALAVGASSITGLLAPGAVALADQVFATGRIALMIPTIWIIPFLAPRYWKTAKPIQPPRHPVPSGPHMSRRTWLRWLIIVLGVSAEFCFWTWGAARLVDAGASDSAASGLAAAFAVGMAFGRFIGPMSIGSLDPIVISALVTSSGAAIVVANSAVPLLVAGLLLAGFGIAVVYPVSLTLLLEDPDLPQDRLIALAAYASGVAITITPTMLGLLDRIMAVQYGFGVVPLTMAAVVWLSRVVNPVRNTSRSRVRGSKPSHRQHCRTRHLAVFQPGEGDVDIHKRVYVSHRLDRNLGSKRQKLFCVLAGEVGDATDRPFLPQQVVGELGHRVEMDGVDRHSSAGADRLQRLDHDVPGRGIRDRRIERYRWLVVVGACPRSSHVDGPLLLRARPCCDEDLTPPISRHLETEQRRSSKTIETEATAWLDSRQLQRPVPDDAAAQQRGRLLVGERRRDTEDKVGTSRHGLRKPTVLIPSGELSRLAQVLLPGPAIAALATGATEPGNPDSRSRQPVVDTVANGTDLADHLMSRNDR